MTLSADEDEDDHSDDDGEAERERGATGGHQAPLVPAQALVSAGLDGSLTLWDLRARAPECHLDAGGGAIWSLAVDERGSGSSEGSAGRRLAAACDDGALRVFVAVKKRGGSSSSSPPPFLKLSAALPRAEGRALSVAWHPGGRALVSGSSAGTLRAWDVASRRELFRVDAAGGSGKSPSKSRSGKSSDESSSSPLWAVAVADDGTLATGDGAGCVSFWDAEHGTLLARFPGAHASDVLALVAAGGASRGSGSGGRGGRRSRGDGGSSFGAGGTIFSCGADGRVASFVHQGGDDDDGDERRVRQRGGERGQPGPFQQQQQQQQRRRNGGWAAGPARAAHTHDVRCLALLSTPSASPRSSAPPPPSAGEGGAGRGGGSNARGTGPQLLVSGGADAQLIVYARSSFATEHPARACRAPQPPLLSVSVPETEGGAAGAGAGAAGAAAAGGPALLLASQRRAVDVWRLGVSSCCFSEEDKNAPGGAGRGKRGGGGGGGGKAAAAAAAAAAAGAPTSLDSGLAEGTRVDVVARPSRLARLELSGSDHVLSSAMASSVSGSNLAVVVAASTPSRTVLFELREKNAADGNGGGGGGGKAVSVRRVALPAGVPPSAAVAFAGPRRLLAAACEDGSLSVIDLAAAAEEEEEARKTPSRVVASLAATLAAPASKTAAAPSSSASTAALSCPPVSGLAVSDCGRWAATWSTGGRCHVFDLKGLEHAWSPPPLASSTSSSASSLAGAAFTADGDLLLLSSAGTLVSYDVQGRALRPPTPQGAWEEVEEGAGRAREAREAGKHGGAISIGDLPGSPTGVSALPKAGSRAVLVCTPSALCSADLAAPRTPGRDPLFSRGSRRAVRAAGGGGAFSSPSSAVPAPAGSNPRPLPLEHPCLGSFFLSSREALLVEAVWADVAAKSLPPPVLRRRFGA